MISSPTGESSFWFQRQQAVLAAGDLALLLTVDQKRFVLKLAPGKRFHTHVGIYAHDDMLNHAYGNVVYSEMGQPALVLEPSLGDLMRNIRRGTQVIYPKDAAYLVHRLNLRAGCRVIEAGTGSGALTLALAWAIAPTGMVYTYEMRAEHQEVARFNLDRFGLLAYTELVQASIDDGFLHEGVDALFLDVREPWRYLAEVRKALLPGGFFASLLPTTNQVSSLLSGLEEQGFVDLAVEELLLRPYKPVPDRLRPEDNMIAHTGFLIFGRSTPESVNPLRWEAKDRQRYRARQRAQREIAADEAARAEERARGGRKYPRMPLP